MANPAIAKVATAKASVPAVAPVSNLGKLDVSKVSTSVTMTGGQLNSAITAIAKAGLKLDARIHEVAIQAILHVMKENDARPLTRLFHAIPASGRRLAFKSWVMEFAPLVFVKDEADGKVREHFRPKEGNPANDYRIATLAAIPYWEWSPEKEPEVFNLQRVVRKLAAEIKWINKHVNDMPEAERLPAVNMCNKLLDVLPKDVRAKLRDELNAEPATPALPATPAPAAA